MSLSVENKTIWRENCWRRVSGRRWGDRRLIASDEKRHQDKQLRWRKDKAAGDDVAGIKLEKNM